jgi:amino acid adenylation domain-containing protein
MSDDESVKSRGSNSLPGGLSAEKRSLLALRALKIQGRAVNARSETIRRLPRVEQPSVFPLSFSQERLWFLDQLEPGGVAYNIPGALRIRGALRAEVLERVVNEIVQRHEVLRARFEQREGVPVQVIESTGILKLETVNLEGVIEAEQKRRIEELAREEGGWQFDLVHGPLLRMKLARLAKEDYVLFFTMHHIVSDGWSIGVLVKEFGRLYEPFSLGQLSPLAELPIQYADYAMWQRGWLQGDVLEKQLGYWKERLAGAPVLDLPTDCPRSGIQSYNGGSEKACIKREWLAELNELSRREGVTLFMALSAAFKVLLHRYSGQTDIVVGTPIANRNHEETEGLVGFFVNTLALRTDLSGNPSFKELLKREREVAMGAYAHQDVPFERLVTELRVERSLNRSPLFQVMLNMLNLGDQTLNLPGLVVEEMAAVQIQSKFDLTLYVREQADGLKLEMVYNRNLFKQKRVEEMLAQMESVLGQAISAPETSLDSFRLATKWMEDSILPQLAMKLEPCWERAVHQLFEAQARTYPKVAAICEGPTCWTYEELDHRSNRLANYMRAQGIGTGDRVAIYGNRSANLVLAILGILKSGGSFLILNPSYPESRLKDQVQLARPRGCLYLEGTEAISPELANCLAGAPQSFSVELPREWIGPQNPFQTHSSDSPLVEIKPCHEAYVAFTSGTTGKPKGIVGTHLSLTHFVQWQGQEFGLGREDNFSLLSGLSHDPLLRDIFTPLSLGARLCIPKEPFWEGRNLAAWVEGQRISVMHLTPALGRLLYLSAGQNRQLPEWPALRYAFFGGDVLPEDVVKGLSELAPSVQCINFYGTTETPQAMGCYRVGNFRQWQNTGLRRIPIGTGIEGVNLLIINQSRQLAGLGELGEIWVRSPYLSIGYLEDEALNRERFQTNWFNSCKGDRMYRTGDLGRYLPDGNIEFWGRKDHQVKIRGFRVELEEIEVALQKHGSVQQSVAVARQDEPEEERLVAYVVLKGGSHATAPELKGYLKESLPEYMVPAFIVVLEKLPLTVNGKVDRKGLPTPAGRQTEIKFEAPRSQLELSIAGVWREMLNTEEIGIHDNFFELGGHSLLATRLISHVRKMFGVELPLRSIFETPTIAGLAEQIKTILWAASGSSDQSNSDRQEGFV